MSKTMPAAEAKTNFGRLLDTAQREPVAISRNGRPVAVVLSMEEFERIEELKLERLRGDIRHGIEQLDRGERVDGAAFMRELISKIDG